MRIEVDGAVKLQSFYDTNNPWHWQYHCPIASGLAHDKEHCCNISYYNNSGPWWDENAMHNRFELNSIKIADWTAAPKWEVLLPFLGVCLSVGSLLGYLVSIDFEDQRNQHRAAGYEEIPHADPEIEGVVVNAGNNVAPARSSSVVQIGHAAAPQNGSPALAASVETAPSPTLPPLQAHTSEDSASKFFSARQERTTEPGWAFPFDYWHQDRQDKAAMALSYSIDTLMDQLKTHLDEQNNGKDGLERVKWLFKYLDARSRNRQLMEAWVEALHSQQSLRYMLITKKDALKIIREAFNID